MEVRVSFHTRCSRHKRTGACEHHFCPSCGVQFERSAGEGTGAMAITLVAVSSAITGNMLEGAGTVACALQHVE
jgi:hypothetical protein